MSKKRILLTLVLFVGCGGIAQAHPLDSPDIVYIDGLPCNAACQSYMSWSRQLTSLKNAPAKLKPRASFASRATSADRRESSEPASRSRVSRPAVPLPPTRTAELPPAAKADAISRVAPANDAAASLVGATAAPQSRTIREQVAAATELAEHVTTPLAGNKVGTAGGAEGTAPSETEPSAPEPMEKTDNRVALVLARPEIKSVADLAGKDVAIEDRQSTFDGSIGAAIASSGATQVKLSPGPAKPIDRLIGGEVPAAVLALVSAEAADWFPEIAGFKIFRVPLASR